MDNQKIKFYVDTNSFWVHGTGVLLALATVFQFIACWGQWHDRFFVLTQLLLPMLSFCLFVVLVMLLGEKALWLSVIPFLGGVAYFGMQAWYVDDRIAMVVGIAYCVLATVLYIGTVFSLIRTKWLIVFLFAIPFCYRAFYRDILILQNVENPASFAAGMREMSLLCALLAMTFLAIGMKKRVRERKAKETPAASAPVPAQAPAAAPAAEPMPASLTQTAYKPSLTLDPPAAEAAPAPAETETTESTDNAGL